MNIYSQRKSLEALFFGQKHLLKNANIIEIDHIDDSVHNTKLKNKVLRFQDIDHPLFNPKENSLIVLDRRMIERDFRFIMEECGFDYRNRLFDIWCKKNVKVLFNFAFFEAIEYETKHYDFFTTDFPFKCLKLTDYELFKDEDNFIFDKLFNIFTFITEHGYREIDNYPNTPHNISKKYLYSSLQKKLRPHRVEFLKNIINKNLGKYGYLTGNKIYFDEYKNNNSMFKTDNCSKQGKYYYTNDHTDFFTEEWNKYSNIFVDNYEESLWSDDHVVEYNNNEEYDLSYIDVNGETHIIYDTMFPNFTEKSYQPIFFEKMFMVYGGNSFFKILDNLGGHNFTNELLLPKDFYKIENPYKQIKLIVDSLQELSTLEFSEIFIESQEKICQNKIILTDYYKKIIKQCNDFTLG